LFWVIILLLLQLQEVQQFYSQNYIFTKAHAHIHALEALGFQPGAVATGVMRTRLINNLAAGTHSFQANLHCNCICCWYECLQEWV
jgi:hypothetical protein